MKPERSDYEIWLIDWLDGKLDKDQVARLMEFLNENPDIREEAELMSHARLDPSEITFKRKSDLNKSVAQLTASQIEYLSVACLENDISEEQFKELEESFSFNAENRKIFDSVQKLKLRPDQNIRFKNKTSLVKGSATGKRFTISRTWLSAAAAVVIIVMSYVLLPWKKSDPFSTALFPAQDSVMRKPLIVRRIAYSSPPETNNQKTGSIPENTGNNAKSFAEKQVIAMAISSDQELIKTMEQPPERVTVFKPVSPDYYVSNYSLIASNIEISYRDFDDDGNRLGRFIARNFREKILKEDLPTDDPLKPYEIAEAGILGINKLFGWEMALVKNNNEEGDLQSLYFDSRLIKFNSPVKKEEPSL